LPEIDEDLFFHPFVLQVVVGASEPVLLDIAGIRRLALVVEEVGAPEELLRGSGPDGLESVAL
jgi:hypothetical protein